MSFAWNYSPRNEMLKISDAYLSFLCCGEASNILEVGVYKGGWILSMAENFSQVKLYGVDPFPGIDDIRKEFLKEAEGHGNLSHFDSIKDCFENISSLMDVIHVDGEHSEFAVERDLGLVLPRLSETGVLIIDDIFYQEFPGVAYATYNFIRANNLAPFLISSSKIYVTRPSRYDFWYTTIKSALHEKQIIFQESQEVTAMYSGYPQSNSVNGYRLLVVSDATFLTKETRKTLGISSKQKEPHYLVKQTLPPIVFQLAKILKRAIWDR